MCYCCGRPNGTDLPPGPRNRPHTTLPQEEWLKARSGVARRPPRDVDDQTLDHFARVARLKDESALWRDAVTLKTLIASKLSAGAVSHERVADFQRRFEEQFAPALTHGGIGRARDVLESIRRQLRDGRREDASPGECDEQSAEIIELMATNGCRADGAKRDREIIRPAFDCDNTYSLRTRDGHGGKEGRPKALGTRDAAEAKRLVLNYFPSSSIEEIRRWARKRGDTRRHYDHVGWVVHRLMDIDRSATANALAEALELKKTALYKLRRAGRHAAALAA